MSTTRRRDGGGAAGTTGVRAGALLCLVLAVGGQSSSSSGLVWEAQTGYPGPGRHHPITFANETHAFLLAGTTTASFATKDFYMFTESTGRWTDLTNTRSAFPGAARSFGYGVVLDIPGSTKAYLGMGAGADGYLSDLWEFDMATHAWRELAPITGPGRRHPAMVAIEAPSGWTIHVGLGDGPPGNLNDWYSYDVARNTWSRAPDFPSSQRHHPFYFGLNGVSYAGLGHAGREGPPRYRPIIERDWFGFNEATQQWVKQADFDSYADGASGGLVTSEARVAGTQFQIHFGNKALGFVLSGDGDDHGPMDTGEFHSFDPTQARPWRALPPHPGRSRWAPGSFVMRGSARAYFTSGRDRIAGTLFSDLWRMDLSPLFPAAPPPPVFTPTPPTPTPPPVVPVPPTRRPTPSPTPTPPPRVPPPTPPSNPSPYYPPPTPPRMTPTPPVGGGGSGGVDIGAGGASVGVNGGAGSTRDSADDDDVTSEAWFWVVVVAVVVVVFAVVLWGLWYVTRGRRREVAEEPPAQAAPPGLFEERGAQRGYQHPDPQQTLGATPPRAVQPGQPPGAVRPHPLQIVHSNAPPSRRGRP